MSNIKYYYFNKDFSITEVEQFVFRTEWLSPFVMIYINGVYKFYVDAIKVMTSSNINDIYAYIFNEYIVNADTYSHFECTTLDVCQEVTNTGHTYCGEFICGILDNITEFFEYNQVDYWSTQKPVIDPKSIYKIWVQHEVGHYLKSDKWTWGLRNISKREVAV